MHQISNENSVEQLPDSVPAFFKIIAKGYSKNLSKNFLKSILIASTVFISNLIISSVIDRGILKDNSVLSLLAVRPGNMLKGSLFWVALPGFLLSFIEKIKMHKIPAVLKSMGSALGPVLNLKRNLKNIAFLTGSSLALLFCMLMGNVLTGIVLFTSFLLSSAFPRKSSLVYIFNFIIKGMRSLLLKKSKGASSMEKGLNLLPGFTFGFGVYSISSPFQHSLLIQVPLLLTVIIMLGLELKKHINPEKSSAKV